MIKSKNVNSAFDIKGIKIINGENKDNENSIIVEDKTEKLELELELELLLVSRSIVIAFSGVTIILILNQFF